MKATTIVTVTALVLLTLGIGSIAYAAYTTIVTIPTTGQYNGSYDVTLNPTTIDWGTPALDTPVTKTITIQNTGTKNINSLTMSPITLVGIATDDFTLTWNLEGQSLTIGESKTATFTFTLTNDPGTTSYSFDIDVGQS